jgi:hypothetical protein
MRAILVQLEMLAITKSEPFLGMLGYDVYEGPYFDGSPKREGRLRVRAYDADLPQARGASPGFPQGGRTHVADANVSP